MVVGQQSVTQVGAQKTGGPRYQDSHESSFRIESKISFPIDFVDQTISCYLVGLFIAAVHEP
jgi:hypothetical protein